MLNQEYFMKNGIEVLINDMKRGKTLFSRDYSICNALIFSDGKTAALAHISNATSPYMLLQGYVSNLLSNPKVRTRKIDSINNIFDDIHKVSAYHIYRPDGCWPNHVVTQALKDNNIKKVYAVPIIEYAFRTIDIGISLKENKIYIFPKSYSEKESTPIIIDINKDNR